MKKFLIAAVTVLTALTILFCGCTKPVDGRDGRDGKDAQDISIYEIYEAAKNIEGNEKLTFDEFLKRYLNYTDSSVDLRAAVNRSMMSGVTILSRFSYTSKKQSGVLGTVNKTSYKVFTGSGAIVWLDKNKGDAYIVTNCHVVYDDTADKIFCQDVRLFLYGQDERGFNYSIDSAYYISGDANYRIKAEVIGASVSYDIALLKVTGSEVLKRSDARAAKFSDAADVYTGEYVYAVGNASGEGLSAANGIISKDSEYIQLTLSEKDNVSVSDYNEYRVMRTSAAINHGNSGGALYNKKGEIVGIVNAKDEGADIDNMGYAIPANTVKPLLGLIYENYKNNGNSMLTGGGIRKAFLNVETKATDSYSQYNSSTGLAVIVEQIMVSSVIGSPASGKLFMNDFLKQIKITDADGNVKKQLKVTRRYHIPDALLGVSLGDTVTLTIERDGKELEVPISYDSESYFKYMI